MRPIFRFLLIFLLFSPLVAAAERQLTCKVVGISDGDTLTCLHERRPLKVRLQYIDAPESAQPFGNRAKQALSTLAFKKTVRLHVTGYDRYQRLLAVVYVGSQNLNLTLVEQGMAWAYRQTLPEYAQAQATAQRQQRGLWRDSHPINPADWRATPRTATPTPSTRAPQIINGINCQIRQSCEQIKDYSTAQRYFQQCGWKELDGNHDGIPCNKLYRKAQPR